MTHFRAGYTPAIHSAALNFIEQAENGRFYVLSPDLFDDLPRLDRDIRAVKPEAIEVMLKALYPDLTIGIINKENVTEVLSGVDRITLPYEDISKEFEDRYVPGPVLVEYIKNFLRWDRFAAVHSRVPDTDSVITEDEFHRDWMSAALQEASKSPDWWRQVGAVIRTQDGSVLLGHNRPYPIEHGTLETFGDPRSNFNAGEHIESSRAIHAEASLIAQAARDGTPLEGSTLYVTTYPCPPCAKLVAEAGIARVYFQDGYSLTDASEVLKAKKIKVVRVLGSQTPQQQ